MPLKIVFIFLAETLIIRKDWASKLHYAALGEMAIR
jgi:hypothetical protein